VGGRHGRMRCSAARKTCAQGCLFLPRTVPNQALLDTAQDLWSVFSDSFSHAVMWLWWVALVLS